MWLSSLSPSMAPDTLQTFLLVIRGEEVLAKVPSSYLWSKLLETLHLLSLR